MRVETVCTGDELLTGLTSDTNSAFFQTRLLERLGVQVQRSTVVGDVREDIIAALTEAASRADVVLVSGGLGPTTDDLTAECAAKALGVPLEEKPEVLEHLEARAKARGFVLTPNNRHQALVPRGSEVVLNAVGSAPMFGLRFGACTLFFVPGVPREYRHLVEHEVLPRLEKLSPPSEKRVLVVLKTLGLPESHLDAKVSPLGPQHPHVLFGYRTHAPENHLKLLASGKTEAEAAERAKACAVACRALLGPHVFGEGEETLAGVTLAALKAKGQTLAVAESITGGRVAAELTQIPGASAVLLGSGVTYVDAAKQRWARVPQGLLDTHGAVSREVAQAMAAGIRDELGTDWGVATTGWAGPGGGDEANPVGTAFVAVAGPHGAQVERHLFKFERELVMRFVAHAAIDLLRRTLE